MPKTKFPAVVELSELDSKIGFKVPGINSTDRSGTSVALGGDLNNDGIDDLAISVPPRADPFSRTNAGSVYVVFGHNSSWVPSMSLSSLDGETGTVFSGENDLDSVGDSVRFVGDINGDGIVDLAIGAGFANPCSRDDAGVSYVIFGHEGPWPATINLATLNGTNGFRVDGAAAGDSSGFSVDGIGDVNGDGKDDLLIGAYYANPGERAGAGAAYIVFGKADAWEAKLDLATLDGTNGVRINGEVDNDLAGFVVSRAGDFNDDGIDDFMVTAPMVSSTAGSTYVVFGRNDTWTHPFELSALDGTNGVKINGESGVDIYSGVSAGRAGDINGDGIVDIVIGSQYSTANENTGAGASYVVFGKSGTWTTPFELSTINGLNGFKMLGEVEDEHSGRSVNGVGDINGDGIDDFIIGVEWATPEGRSKAGSGFVVFGHTGNWTTSLVLSTLDGTDGFRINGIATDDFLGVAVSGGGDINNDGIADLIISSNRINSLTGESYVIFGDISPELVENKLTINQGSTVGVTTGALNVTSVSDDVRLLIGDLQYGHFEYVSNPEVSISNFTKSDLVDNIVQFVHDDGQWAPTYTVTLDNGDKLAQPVYQADQVVSVTFKHRTRFPAVIKLADLNGMNGFRVEHESPNEYDNLGVSVSRAGDINADGIEDFLIGSPYTNKYGMTNSGSTYVLFGRSGNWTTPFMVSSLGGFNGFRIDGGEDGEKSGYSVSSAGDINGDGIGDLIVGSYDANSNGETLSGAAYVVFGKASNWTSPFVLSAIDGENGFRINGLAFGDHLGVSVAGVGDLNGDDIDDVVVGASLIDPHGFNSGGGYAVFGKTSPWTTPLQPTSLNGANGFKFEGEAKQDRAGYRVAGVGDVNGDGREDFAILTQGGSAYLLFGKDGAWTNPLALSTLDGTNGVEFIINAGSMEIAWSVARAGDINGDKFNDIVIGYGEADPLSRTDAGAVYVIFGHGGVWSNQVNLDTLDGSNGFAIYGLASGDRTGTSVGGGVDVNGDGIDDLIIGAPEVAVGSITSGVVYVVYGSKSSWSATFDLSTLDGTNGFRIDGIGTGDNTGISVIGLRDINDDGIGDILIGAPSATVNGQVNAGVSYVVFGDVSPEFSFNQLSIKKGEVMLVTTANLDAYDINNADFTFFFTISDIQYGQFEYISNPHIEITEFTLDEIKDGKIQFRHDDSSSAPSYTATVQNGGLAYLEQDAIVSFALTNDLTVLTTSSGTLSYTEDDPAIYIDPAITIMDIDNTLLRRATVSITSNFASSQDELSFVDQNGITGYYNNAMGILTLTGYATIEDYQTALQSVKYINLSDDPTTQTRIISFVVNDGVEDSPTAYRNIQVIAVNDSPVLLGSGGVLDYLENSTPRVIDYNVWVSDVDNVELTGATIAITSNFNANQDVLSFVDKNGIVGSYNDETGVLTLTGAATKTRYQMALRSVKYENLSDDPATDLRTVSFTVNDGLNSSLPIT